jgi:peptidoglycan-associated lipoprotein
MSFAFSNPARAILIGVAAISMAACASRPKPMGPVAPEAPRPSAAYPEPGLPPVSEGQMSGVPLPGSVRDFVINAGDLVYFEFDRFEVNQQARPTLDAQAAWLQRYPAVQVRIEGNCDDRGTREYNFALGARRANAVRDYLVSRGLSPARITTVSYGKERPIDPGTDDAAMAKDRNAHTAIIAGAR